MAFGNERDASEILAALKAERHIVAAGLYDRDGKLFSRYPADLPCRRLPGGAAGRWLPFRQFIRRRLSAGRAGQQAARHALSQIRSGRHVRAVSAIFRHRRRRRCASLLVAFMVSTVLQRQISGPILALATTAHAIADRRDYSVRATKGANDELGLLTDAFNQMLTRIDEQDRALRESDERLNLALMSSGVGTWSWNIVENSMIWDDYMHPLYGLAPKTFPGQIEDALCLMHPDDRDHVEEDIGRDPGA